MLVLLKITSQRHQFTTVFVNTYRSVVVMCTNVATCGIFFRIFLLLSYTVVTPE